MAKFIYKFESVMKVKETQEKKVQKEISLIDLEIEKVNQSLHSILSEIENTRAELGSKTSLRASELQFHQEVEYLLGLQMKKLKEELQQLSAERDNKILELAQKSKEHKMFESLGEKHYENFVLDQNQSEQKEIDEMALKNFVRED